VSANNVWIGKEHKGKFYGWDEMAEESMNDEGTRVLHYASAMVEADAMKELQEEMDKRSYLGYAEYGWDFSGHLPKDGTPIKFVE